MKVLTVVGARPQFIKAATVSRAFRKFGIDEEIVHTGQHYDDDMSDRFFAELGIPKPVENLEVGSSSHGVQTAKILEGLEAQILKRKPDFVLVYGDTNSTMAGALAAVKLHVPVAHVEAGLRSFNRRMPEEINRIVTDAVADILFTPTQTASDNLKTEGVPDSKVVWSGDVMYDAALIFGSAAEESSTIVSDLGLSSAGYVLATVHRAENTDDPDRLRAIFEGLATVAKEMPVLLPLHPRTRGALEKSDLQESVKSALRILDPVGYLDMLMLQRSSAIVVTDSGGVQKEAFFQGVPCVTLRDETEWVELVDSGWNRIQPPTGAEAVATAVLSAIGTKGSEMDAYGKGDASEIVARTVLEAGH